MTLKKLRFVERCLAIAVLSSILFFTTGCNQSTSQEAESTTPVATSLSREQVENLVRRSYQYVALFNVIQKMVLDPSSGDMFMGGFNKPAAGTELMDHTVRAIARPNNDTLYQGAVLDLRHDPVIIEYPVIDSNYVALQTSGYDHYTAVPLASSLKSCLAGSSVGPATALRKMKW